MTTPADRESLLRSLLGPLDRAAPPAPDCMGFPPLVFEMISAFVHWEAGPARAEAAVRKLCESVVDANELRVCLPAEISRRIGERYPRSFERSHRLRAALNDLYRREYEVTLEPIREMNKREAREYLATLEGMPPFVVARLMLAIGGHAMPLDTRLLDALKRAGVFDGGETVETGMAWLERHIRANETPAAYYALEEWAARAQRPVRASRSDKRAAMKPRIDTSEAQHDD